MASLSDEDSFWHWKEGGPDLILCRCCRRGKDRRNPQTISRHHFSVVRIHVIFLSKRHRRARIVAPSASAALKLPALILLFTSTLDRARQTFFHFEALSWVGFDAEARTFKNLYL